MAKLTHKQETFARNVVKGMTQIDAYKNAYDAENSSADAIYVNACNLAKNTKVALRVEELRARQQKILDYDLAAHMEELELARQLAMTPRGEDGRINEGAVIRATELKGKVVGHYVDKQEIKAEVSGNISVNIITGGKK